MTIRHICNERCDGDQHYVTKRRAIDDIRIVPTAALTATSIALVAFAIQYTHAAMWAAVVALILAVAGLFMLAKETLDLRAELDDADRRAEDLEAALVDALADSPPHDLTERMVQVTRDRTRLRVVPEQRDGGRDHLKADDDWFARLYDDKGDLR